MARFTGIQYLELGKYICDLIADPQKIANLQRGDADALKNLKDELKAFMTPINYGWNDIKIVPHFDTATEVHIAFPFTGDVEGSIAAFCPPDGQEGDEYAFPPHYGMNPNAGLTPAERNENRKTIYLSRLGDYVMTRCR